MPCYTSATMLLTPFFGKDTWLVIGVLLLLFGVFGMGYVTGRFPEHDWGAPNHWAQLPWWTGLAFIALIIGVAIMLGTLGGSGCEQGPCEPAGRP